MAQSYIQVNWNMTDGTTLQQTFGPYNPTSSVLTNIKENIIALNKTPTAEQKVAVQMITNSNGANATTSTAIASAVIITKDSTVLFGEG